jgi:hypothetical protein
VTRATVNLRRFRYIERSLGVPAGGIGRLGRGRANRDAISETIEIPSAAGRGDDTGRGGALEGVRAQAAEGRSARHPQVSVRLGSTRGGRSGGGGGTRRRHDRSDQRKQVRRHHGRGRVAPDLGRPSSCAPRAGCPRDHQPISGHSLVAHRSHLVGPVGDLTLKSGGRSRSN